MKSNINNSHSSDAQINELQELQGVVLPVADVIAFREHLKHVGLLSHENMPQMTRSHHEDKVGSQRTHSIISQTKSLVRGMI